MATVVIPSLAEVNKIHEALVVFFSKGNDPITPSRPRDLGLLESACRRPFAEFGGRLQYQTVPEALAALFHSLIKNHPFHNGNKRTALVALLLGLSKNKRVFQQYLSDDEVFTFVVGVTDGSFFSEDGVQEVQQITSWLRQHTDMVDSPLHQISIRDFERTCRELGAKISSSKGRLKIQGSVSTVSIRNDTTTLEGGKARHYLEKLGFSKLNTGFSAAECFRGLPEAQEQINRFKDVITRLAHA